MQHQLCLLHIWVSRCTCGKYSSQTLLLSKSQKPQFSSLHSFFPPATSPVSLRECAFLDEFIKWLRKLQRACRGSERRTDQVIYSNEPCQQYSAYKQIGLTDDTVASLVSISPANHLSTLVWTPGNVSLCWESLLPPFPPPLPLSHSISLFCLSLCKTSGSLFLGHHGKSLVIIFSALSFPTHTLSLASSLPLLMKLWIMLVSKSLQGLHRGSTNHKAAALFISLLKCAFFLPQACQSWFKLPWSPDTLQCTIFTWTIQFVLSKLDGVTKWQNVSPIVAVFFYPTCHPPPIFYGRTM